MNIAIGGKIVGRGRKVLFLHRVKNDSRGLTTSWPKVVARCCFRSKADHSSPHNAKITNTLMSIRGSQLK